MHTLEKLALVYTVEGELALIHALTGILALVYTLLGDLVFLADCESGRARSTSVTRPYVRFRMTKDMRRGGKWSWTWGQVRSV